uniref:(northern house mosquito) hypothetical protein n=1 Tax=Culex pipiens TaxID=7175 RepID=A0A8D8HKX1_CULPI
MYLFGEDREKLARWWRLPMKVLVVFRSEENGITLNLTSGFASFSLFEKPPKLGDQRFSPQSESVGCCRCCCNVKWWVPGKVFGDLKICCITSIALLRVLPKGWWFLRGNNNRKLC